MSDQAKLKLSGVIDTIFPPEIKGMFEKRILWLREEDVERPQTYPIEFQQGNCVLLDRYQPGDGVEIRVNLRGNKWTKDGEEKCMSNLVGWAINMQRSTIPQSTPPVSPSAPPAPPAGGPQGDDLPF
ncbi:DUF3127 domain-containing protein [Chitinophaga sp. sic0106]|uniref:DUF3127 domain-containing protein n=1 Tax=Chitinophaga sp. sic0106 TaxID=2854785 RepID=UPI001C47CEFC|nr:DUF3127 domain-containing protein [Chitinophaga sp. sic0106]MBV7531312.1 DUF3127 domain-containing protein [Chitinophaga sp. sic0106]